MQGSATLRSSSRISATRRVKKRLKLQNPTRSLCDESLAFIDACHIEMYGRPLGRQLMPVIGMEYERITLVAREGGERMTIDTRLAFRAANADREAAPDMFILETKSAARQRDSRQDPARRTSAPDKELFEILRRDGGPGSGGAAQPVSFGAAQAAPFGGDPGGGAHVACGLRSARLAIVVPHQDGQAVMGVS